MATIISTLIRVGPFSDHKSERDYIQMNGGVGGGINWPSIVSIVNSLARPIAHLLGITMLLLFLPEFSPENSYRIAPNCSA